MLRVDDSRSEPRVHKMAEDAESDIAVRFVDENDDREISAKALAVSAKRKVKKNGPSWLVLAESSSEEDEKVSPFRRRL